MTCEFFVEFMTRECSLGNFVEFTEVFYTHRLHFFSKLRTNYKASHKKAFSKIDAIINLISSEIWRTIKQ